MVNHRFARHWVHRVTAAIVIMLGCLVVGAGQAHAQPGRALPPDVAELYRHKPVVELVTMGIGSLIWERHGHIALCIRYDDANQDACYNYGIGDFHHPVAMGTGFFRGTKSFYVGKMNPSGMLDIYRYADRSIWVQPLPLSQQEVQNVIIKLESDIREENKYYAYDHFWDNCTTRVRDVLDGATGGKISAMVENPGSRTYRDLARDGFYGMRMALLITDMAMGRATDRVPTYFERMFLPDYMREAATKLWGVQPIPIYQRRGPPPLKDGPSGRVLFALLVLLITAPAILLTWLGRGQRIGIAVAILPPALLGLAFWVLAIISPLPYVHINESCLIFFPLDVLLFALPLRLRRSYARGRVISLALIAALLVVGVLKQPLLAPLLWPLIPALLVGFWRDGWNRNAALAKQP
ncbi:MAG: DUF4105 domain-containing protein [Kofleriaceae bacterium]|nr:DUF4105 domain-containing protein [Kofleriaceae bacterium]